MSIYQTAHYQVREAAVNEVKAAIAGFVDHVRTSEPGTRLYAAWQHAGRPDPFRAPVHLRGRSSAGGAQHLERGGPVRGGVRSISGRRPGRVHGLRPRRRQPLGRRDPYGHGGASAPHSTWSSSAATAAMRSVRDVNERPPPGSNDGTSGVGDRRACRSRTRRRSGSAGCLRPAPGRTRSGPPSRARSSRRRRRPRSSPGPGRSRRCRRSIRTGRSATHGSSRGARHRLRHQLHRLPGAARRRRHGAAGGEEQPDARQPDEEEHHEGGEDQHDPPDAPALDRDGGARPHRPDLANIRPSA